MVNIARHSRETTYIHFLDTRNGTSIISEKDTRQSQYYFELKISSTHPPNAAKQTIPIPTSEDLRPPSMPDETTAAPPPGIVARASGEEMGGEERDVGLEKGGSRRGPL
jgi:hypothetical protein